MKIDSTHGVVWSPDECADFFLVERALVRAIAQFFFLCIIYQTVSLSIFLSESETKYANTSEKKWLVIRLYLAMRSSIGSPCVTCMITM